MNYPKYAEMKDSGIEWLGKVPDHWQLKRLKVCTHLINEKYEAMTESMRYVGLENIESNTGKFLTNGADFSPEGTPNLFKKNDVLFGKLRPYLAKGLVAGFDGVCSSEILVLRPIEVLPNYLLYYLLSDGFIKSVDSSTYGAKMPRASWEFIGNMMQLVPSLNEQQAIINFLDDKTARIDELIGKKERQIELLAEKRQAVISEAVTKGLNPAVPMRDSGIEWLGEVPAHWETSKIKLLSTKIGSGKTPKGGSQVYVDSGVLFIRSQNVYDDGLRLDDVVYIDQETDAEMQYTRVKPKDVLLNITGASIGRTCIVPDNFPKANVNQHVCIIRLSVRCVPEYISYCLKSNTTKEQILSLETGSSREGLNFEQVGNLTIAVPSTNYDEQRQIVDYLNTECSKTEEAVNKIQKQINKLREYRQALITAAVTGKIDVRNIFNAGGFLSHANAGRRVR